MSLPAIASPLEHVGGWTRPRSTFTLSGCSTKTAWPNGLFAEFRPAASVPLPQATTAPLLAASNRLRGDSPCSPGKTGHRSHDARPLSLPVRNGRRASSTSPPARRDAGKRRSGEGLGGGLSASCLEEIRHKTFGPVGVGRPLVTEMLSQEPFFVMDAPGEGKAVE